jgi:hypothetical protein
MEDQVSSVSGQAKWIQLKLLSAAVQEGTDLSPFSLIDSSYFDGFFVTAIFCRFSVDDGRPVLWKRMSVERFSSRALDPFWSRCERFAPSDEVQWTSWSFFLSLSRRRRWYRSVKVL